MKRFFCTTCKKVKHVRVLPSNVIEDANKKAPSEFVRTGTCRFHTEMNHVTTRAQVNHRGHVGAHLGSTRKTSASSAKTKSKKG